MATMDVDSQPHCLSLVEASPSRKKTKGGVNVFQYAATVEQTAWNDEQQRELQRRIAGLRELPKKRPRESTVDPSTAPPTTSNVRPSTPAEVKPMGGAPQYKRSSFPGPSKTYTIIPQDDVQEEQSPRRRNATAPPKVWSTKEIESAKRAAQFKLYDAVLSTNGTVPQSETDAEIEKFLPLLKDYLNLDGMPLPPAPVNGEKDSASMDEDYVYDVFYHHPTTVQELCAPGSASNIARLTTSTLPFVQYRSSTRTQWLTGEDDSDEEYSDEDDEDSNAEDWYTNDYPDEEESDRDDDDGSDAFHEHSESDDVIYPGEGRVYHDVMSDDF
ncbi:uncharacterized protein BXZ73DRAFT_79186 [Epithele typhae]|uniref:uncharacterized protein n=1 Tax=Epithele typhae TaxID=378194 RepID=UPI0020080E75|nr:uncharacterized protein BXZ73DRAFT_79186 [Epithele typhae]KAH9924625.1 hypothetical protein BXZ73DRAFT_79186 [Epithele typhae]